PITCASAGYECDIFPDGCCGYIDCGTCTAPNICGGGGVIGKCGCTPDTCQAEGFVCGTASDHCGGTMNCGTCPSGQYCATFFRARHPCPAARAVLDPCRGPTYRCTGGTPNSGTCPNGAPCINNVCCTPQNTCANNGLNCGTVSDDCGGTLNCGTCPTGQTCVNNVCVCSLCSSTADRTPGTSGSLGRRC